MLYQSKQQKKTDRYLDRCELRFARVARRTERRNTRKNTVAKALGLGRPVDTRVHGLDELGKLVLESGNGSHHFLCLLVRRTLLELEQYYTQVASTNRKDMLISASGRGCFCLRKYEQQ